ncbi:hypothetical protein BC829DRAFT_397505 [Chytridium lagenaria]|nr:hypothetical protein BC829DRAFT_397505 [Chytridium lagenaria]
MLATSELDQYLLPNAPPHIYYIPDFITPAQESQLIQSVNSAPLPKWTVLRNRRLQNWGCTPAGKNGVALPEKLPGWLEEQAVRIEETGLMAEPMDETTGRRPRKPNHVLVNEYAPGQGIMPHDDGPAYLPTVATISLGEYTVLDLFKHHLGQQDVRVCSLVLQPRSLLVLTEQAYTSHLHGIEENTADELQKGRIANWEEAGLGKDDQVVMERQKTRISLTYRCPKRVAKVDLMSSLLKRK